MKYYRVGIRVSNIKLKRQNWNYRRRRLITVEKGCVLELTKSNGHAAVYTLCGARIRSHCDDNGTILIVFMSS